MRIGRLSCLAVCMAALNTPTVRALTAEDGIPAQERRIARPDSAAARRLALVVGNDAYQRVPLSNARNDAVTMTRVLREVGFEVQEILDGSGEAMDRAIAQFTSRVSAGDVVLFYYSGHGVQVGGENYLVPVDYQGEDEIAVKRRTIAVGDVDERLRQSGARVRILILDACRDNPYKATRSGSQGLAAFNAQGALVAFATGPGSTASDNPGGRNGLFTQHLVDALRVPGLGASDLFRQVRQRVMDASAGKQFPWLSDGLVGEFVFRPNGTETPAPSPVNADLARREELAFWESIKDSMTPELFEEYLRRYGDRGLFAVVARTRITPARPAPKASDPGVAVAHNLTPGVFEYAGRMRAGGTQWLPVSATRTIAREGEGWRITAQMLAGEHTAFNNSQTCVFDDRTLALRRCSFVGAGATTELAVVDGKLTWSGPGSPVTIGLEGALFGVGPAALPYVTTLPLTEGFSTSYRTVGAAGVLPMQQVKVVGIENVTVPAGRYSAYKVELSVPESATSPTWTVWIASAPRTIVKYSWSTGAAEVVFELKK